jgi:hypothetical protein
VDILLSTKSLASSHRVLRKKIVLKAIFLFLRIENTLLLCLLLVLVIQVLLKNESDTIFRTLFYFILFYFISNTPYIFLLQCSTHFYLICRKARFQFYVLTCFRTQNILYKLRGKKLSKVFSDPKVYLSIKLFSCLFVYN